ncbi:hypothetical protein PsorP6_016472 [Peronosclerospora sorghi]|uniref:Uncharacterized protein n=1 Tax=Peronosclerospora sorghi TaxID=230839 RepID=A0ACC0VQJ1_9STRA|nr:hypothetical protein PsorP6_016472 [Peronosclerospora sorghi]
MMFAAHEGQIASTGRSNTDSEIMQIESNDKMFHGWEPVFTVERMFKFASKKRNLFRVILVD